MKEKLGTLALLVVLVVLLLLCNSMLKKQENSSTNNIENTTNNIVWEENVMSENVLEVTSESFEKEVLESEKTVLIDFYADWCGPCKRLSPIVDEVANEIEDIKFVKVNIDNAEDIAIKYQVMSIPTLVVIKNGEEANRSVGLIDKEQIIDLIK